MEPLYFDSSCPPELDYQSFEAPPHIPFPYDSSSVQASSSLHRDFHQASTTDGAIEVPSHHQNPDYAAPHLREEGPDPSSRPRLTTEQTNILEAKFQQDPKPPTDTKKEIAQSIGLPPDKVNNWYQNRRAKAKNAKKAETYSILSMPVAPERRMSGSSVTMPEDPMMKASYSLWMPEMSSMGPLTGEPVYSAMTDSFSNMMAGDMAMAVPAPLLNPFDVSDLQQDWRVDEEELRRLMRSNDQAMDEMLVDKPPSQMLLEQSASSISAQYNMPSNVLPSGCGFQSPTITQQHALQGSPDPSSFAPSPQHGPEQTFSRRGSETSELASNLDTIRLVKAQLQTVKEKSLGEPQLPILNLAARRKKVPGALGALATGGQSSVGPQTTSPSMLTTAHRPASAVRRIKSTGNSLNVVNSGRIQKSGAASAQRSPLNVATFAEAEAMNHINAFTAPSPSTSQGTSVNGTIPMTPHTPAPMEHPGNDWSKPLVHSTSIPNMHQHQHQQFHSSPYTTHAASPPMVTPYIQMPPRYMTNMYPMPPQSAPAHVTHFPDFSPEVHSMTAPSASYFPPQPAPQQPYAYQMGPSMVPTQMSPVPTYHCQPPPPQYYSYYQPHIMNNSPPPAFNPGYYAVQPTQPPPPAPVQELTWMPKTEFEGASPPPKEAEAHRPRQYEFHYMGPNDF